MPPNSVENQSKNPSIVDKAKSIFTGLVAVPATIYGTGLAALIEIQRLGEVLSIGPSNQLATREYQTYLMEFVTNLDDPGYYVDPGNLNNVPATFSTSVFLLHALSANMNLASHRKNSDLRVKIPAMIEHGQKQLDLITQAITPAWAHTLIRTIATGLGYSTPTLLPQLPSPLAVMEILSSETYRFVPLLPHTLAALWTLGLLTTLNDVTRINAGLVIAAQKFEERNGASLFETFYNSFLLDPEKKRRLTAAQREALVIDALKIAGVDQPVLDVIEKLDLSKTHSLRQAVGKTTVETNALLATPNDVIEIKKRQIKLKSAVKPIVAEANKYLRDEHGTPRTNRE